MTRDQQWDEIQKQIGMAQGKARAHLNEALLTEEWRDAVASAGEDGRLAAMMFEVRRIRHLGLDVDPLIWKLTRGGKL
ncbi:hypothetical protein D3C80_1497510 [compost metagenome]